MKLKVTISDVPEIFTFEERYALAILVVALNRPSFARDILDEVLVKHLRVPPRGSANEWGPADYFDQECDRMIPWHPDVIGIDITISGVSVTHKRSVADFWTAADELLLISKTVTESLLLIGMGAQLQSRLALDKAIPHMDKPGETSLLERGPIMVAGKLARMDRVTEEMVLAVELTARLGEPTAKLWLKRLALRR